MLNLYTYLLDRMRRDEEGQTLVEYALILSLVSVVVAASLTLLQVDISAIYEDIF